MKASSRLSLGTLLAALVFTTLVTAEEKGGAAPEKRPGSVAGIQAAADKGAAWLATQQNTDGGYGPFGDLRVKNASDVGITAFAIYALAKSGPASKGEAAASLGRAVDFLLAKQQENGAFYDPKDPTLQNYKTCVALLALNTLDRAKHAGAIQKAQAFIKAQQFDEDDGYKAGENVGFGGIGYGSKQRPDLSNTQFALEALAESGVSGSEELWKKAVVFVARCQNSKTVDPLLQKMNVGTTKDGGFRYTPDETRGPAETLDTGPKIFSSYGSMTYAALKSLLYASASKDDQLVKDAFDWISRNFTVRENPGMATKANPKSGQQGLYYYYHTMAKALSLYGQPIIKDEKGVGHDWAKELGDHLISLQNADGYWKSTSERWYEEIPVLATSYAVVALVECRASLEKASSGQLPGSTGGQAPAAK
jgi:squalene-hopene/tetraprenyl-beta-curcumene cyclase